MKKAIYIMALGAFGIITTEFGVIGILPTLAKEFGVSIDMAGWLLSGFALTVALAGPFMTLLTARIDRRTIMALVMGTFVLSNMLSAFSTGFAMLLIARIIPAFLSPVFWAVAIVAAAKQVPPKDAPKAVAIISGGLSIATVIGVPITSYVADLFNWQASFVFTGIINLVAFAALLLFVPPMPVKEKIAVKDQLVILRKGQFLLALFTVLIMLAGMFSTYGYLAEYLGKLTQLNGKQISLMLLLFGAAGIAGNWLTGIALSKNVILTIRLFLSLLILAHLAAYTFGGLFIPMIFIISLWGLIQSGGFLIAQTRAIAEAPEAPELATSLMASFANAGITLGTLLGGAIIVAFGIHEVIWISTCLLLITLALSFIKSGKQRKAGKTSTKEEKKKRSVAITTP